MGCPLQPLHLIQTHPPSVRVQVCFITPQSPFFPLKVCEQVRQAYSDAYLTAHFEVPGEMFTLAMQVRKEEG